MTREEKNIAIDALADRISNSAHFYVTDLSNLTALETNKLRALCFKKEVTIQMAKNTLIKKALEKVDGEFDEMYDILKGNSAIFFSETANTPAKLIKQFRKDNDKPVLKGACIDSSIYIGDDQLTTLSELKSKEELIGEIIGLLQSPAKNVISALQSGGQTLSGILKTLEDKSE
ncbi:MAG: 50S ribosomal protein L10 [Bacteroidia bacterium]|nr:50S ribosomal protein L10 [Bacteroidia bacterium]NNM16886.1 50S ribosomal protein L10 [Bacteroidia bacterium]